MDKKNFIEQIIAKDIKNKKHSHIVTRFPPEPNGYLHIGHIKAIVLNFSLIQKFPGFCNLRFDDTNPQKEEHKFVTAIKEDLHYLGFKPHKICYASDYFDDFYKYAVDLIEKDLAFVDESSYEQIKKERGTLTRTGTNSKYRQRPKDESQELLAKMKNGDFSEGSMVLRAKIDMQSPNLNMRDPVIYRILHDEHQRTGNKWHIYPMYDFAHCISDSIEGITHSLCTLEFEDNRPLYEWFLDKIEIKHKPRQIEFARLNIQNTVLSKRVLKRLVEDQHVAGWDDVRMPTIASIRKQQIPPSALISFCHMIGVTKKDSTIEKGALDGCILDELNKNSPRAMAVLNPIKLTISNYPNDTLEYIDAKDFPQNKETSYRKMAFGKVLYIEKNDVKENAPKKYFRFDIGREVRLKYAYYLTCTDIIKNNKGDIVEIICKYDKNSRGGKSADKRKVRGTIHWVCAQTAIGATINLYQDIFHQNKKIDVKDLKSSINPESCIKIKNAKLEKVLEKPDNKIYQFERLGYFSFDDKKQEYNRVMTL
jgi:glutaminyl-tRNA synthetase